METLDESLLDSLAGDGMKIDWRTLPVNIVMAWASLFSGAVLGPRARPRLTRHRCLSPRVQLPELQGSDPGGRARGGT